MKRRDFLLAAASSALIASTLRADEPEPEKPLFSGSPVVPWSEAFPSELPPDFRLGVGVGGVEVSNHFRTKLKKQGFYVTGTGEIPKYDPAIISPSIQGRTLIEVRSWRTEDRELRAFAKLELKAATPGFEVSPGDVLNFIGRYHQISPYAGKHAFCVILKDAFWSLSRSAPKPLRR